MKIEETFLERDDNSIMAISGITNVEETFFSISQHDFHSRTWGPRCRLTIEYAMSLDVNVVSRSVYTFFDVLGNVGGLAGVLFSITGTIN